MPNVAPRRDTLTFAGLLVVLPAIFIYLMILAVSHGLAGFALVLGVMAAAGFVTDWHVRRRDARSSTGALVAEHRINLDDGASHEELGSEHGPRPMPTRMLAYRYAAAWSTRPEAVRRIAPPFWRSLAVDLLGIGLGIALFVAIILALLHL